MNSISVINEMFFMFVIVGKVVNLSLPFVTCMIFFCSFRIALASDEIMVEVISFDFRRSYSFTQKISLYSLYNNNIELIDVNSVTEKEMQSLPKEFLKSM